MHPVWRVASARPAEPYRSAIREALGGRSELERLAVKMYARGLSVRDIESAFTDASGKSLLSKTAVSQITERLWADYQSVGRDLREHRVLCVFIDGIAERLHLGQPREAVLTACGICDNGENVVLGLCHGTKEDAASAHEFLRGLRNLNDPWPVASDGAPGPMRAIEEVFPRSLRQRCLADPTRDLEGKVPQERWREVKARALAAYTAASPMLARRAKEDFFKRFERELPSATACFLDDFEACIAHLRLPIAHRKAIRTTNLHERMFGEGRRSTKVILHAFGERAVLKLMYAALIRASQKWRRVVVSEFELKQIDEFTSGRFILRDRHRRVYASFDLGARVCVRKRHGARHVSRKAFYSDPGCCPSWPRLYGCRGRYRFRVHRQGNRTSWMGSHSTRARTLRI